ncbi:MAG: trypsin-like peptidase domain-containing protein [Eubacterium sp.]|nr:trypsin-like peptidase domain-containing protein [Eubacterium sp.]
MYYEEFDNKNENNEFVDAEYEDINGGNGSSGGESNKPPKKPGKGPIIALIVAIVVIGVSICGIGGYVMLKSVGDTPNIITNQNETQAEKDIGSTNTGNSSDNKYTVTDVSGVVEDAMPSVVAITSTTFVEASNNDIYDFYFGNGYGNSDSGKQKQKQVAAGSGFIVDQNNNELLIVTNNHVVEDADELAIQFYGQKNKETVKGTIKGTNEKLDVAVVSVKMSDIPSKIKQGIKKATLGDSNQVKVGNGAIAIGNALGFGQSVTSGVISAIDRTVDIDNKKMTLIQTDAPINGGNSGGALLNKNGEVIGINVAKYSSSGSSGTVEGMGFAIPITSVKSEISKLEKQQSRQKQSEGERGYLGIRGQTVNEQDSEMYSIPKGVLVREVFKGEAADKAGIEVSDVITELDGKTIESMDDLTSALDYYKAGETVKVKVAARDDGYKKKTVKVTLSKQSTNTSDSNQDQNNNNYNNNDNYNNGDNYEDDDEDNFFSFPW